MTQDIYETKLQRHARKFRDCSDQGVVLDKYATKAETADRRELMTYMSHVCGWVILAQPLSDAATRRGARQHSPILVLAKMLRLKGRRQLDHRARAALEAVASCCSLILGGEACDNEQDWMELSRALPTFSRKRKREHGNDEEPAFGDMGTDDIYVFKRVRRLNKAICSWRSLDVVQSQDYATSLREQLEQTLEDETVDTVRLRKLLYTAVGALSSPRLPPTCSDDPVPLDEVAASRLRASAAFQKCMRSTLTRGINAWRESLNLEDAQIAPVLEHVRTLIKNYEEKHEDVQQACAGKQWYTLKLLVSLAGDSREPKPGMESTQKAKGLPSTLGGIFNPNPTVRALPHVKQCLDQNVRLKCSSCGIVLTSNWYAKNSKGVPCVLIPNNHHYVAKKRCGHYVPEDGTTPTMTDHASNLRNLSNEAW